MVAHWQRYARLRREIFQRDGKRCQLCGTDLTAQPYEVDHIKPRCEGGTNARWNLRTLCQRCHRKETNELLAKRAHERRFQPNPEMRPTRKTRARQRQGIIAQPPPQAHKGNDSTMGLNLNELYPSKWLKADEFEEGEQRVLTIADVKLEAVGKPGANQEDKPVLYFEDDKPMVLNKTNAHIVGKLYGMDTDAWIGQRVTVFAMDVDSFGEIVRALRIRPTVPAGRPVQQPRQAVAQQPQYAPQQQYAPRPQRQVQPVAAMPDDYDTSDPFADA